MHSTCCMLPGCGTRARWGHLRRPVANTAGLLSLLFDLQLSALAGAAHAF